MTLLSADAYFNRKVKVRNNVVELHFWYVCMVWWVVVYLRLCPKPLILSKSLNKRKLDSLAYSLGMKVFAYMQRN